MSRNRNTSRQDFLDNAWDDHWDRVDRKNKHNARRQNRHSKQYAWDEV